SEMAVRSVVDGVEFGNGALHVSLKGQRLNIDSFSLQGAGGAGGGGELTATGFATWAPSATGTDSPLQAITMQIDAKAKALRISARADRRLTVSGNLQAMLDQALLRIRGALSVDQALFILPEETAPTLGDDVVVLRPTKAPASAAAVPARPTLVASKPDKPALKADLQVTLELGNDFRVRGHGIDTRVAGVLALSSTLQPGESPRVTGALRTVGGQYRAYGQRLDIERGQMRFTGSYDNPSLDILAIRPKLTQRVGVQITGTALLPRVRLYAEPDLPDAEKLAWLVLGRSGANGGAEAAVLQQAAFALLGGQDSSGGIASKLGLDELSFAGAADSGSGGASGATVTLGKRISQSFYVAYERSLAGTLGTFSIFYDLSQRFTLRASTGEKSAVDLIYKFNYD
ncbi:MAG: translocation/assembly module TamB domain-containing protein, partial [Burkholderiaceae bacterium]